MPPSRAVTGTYLCASSNLCYTACSMSTPKPTRNDVTRLVVALFATKASLDRARRSSRSASALTVLQVLEGREGVRPSEIAASLQVHPSHATRQVQELERGGYVEVTVNAGDRRSCLVSLTELGQREAERLRQVGLDRFALFVAGWDAAEVRELARLLEKLEASKAAIAKQEECRTGRRRWRQKV